MFRKIRRINNEISAQDAKALLRNNKRAAFSVNGDDGYPYTIPVNFYYDEDEDIIYLHSAKKGHKIDSIKANDKVCFTTWDDGYREGGDWAFRVSSCVVFGRAKLIADRTRTQEKVRKLACKYYPSSKEAQEDMEDEFNRAIDGVQLIAIAIEHISGKRILEK